jgi:hypothetical protein
MILQTRIILLYILLSVLNASGQELIVLFPNGLTNGIINNNDTLDALVQKGDKFELLSTSIKVDSIFQPIIDEIVPNYRINCNEKPIVLFKNHNFRKDNITGYDLNYKFLEPDSTITIRIKNNEFKIRAAGDIIYKGNYKTINNYQLFIDWPDFKVILRYKLLSIDSVQITSENLIEAPKLIWVGDLDNDNIMDLIVDEATHYAQVKLGLYLSKIINGVDYPRTLLIEGSFD